MNREPKQMLLPFDPPLTPVPPPTEVEQARETHRRRIETILIASMRANNGVPV